MLLNEIKHFIIHMKTQIENLVFTPGQELNRWAALIRYQVQLWRFCGRRLRENNSMAMSAALSFRTIFALVPVLVLSLLILRMVVSPDESRQFIRDRLATAGISEKIAMRVEGDGEPAPPSDTFHQESAEPLPVSSKSAQDQASAEGNTVRDVNLVDEIMKVVDKVDQKLTFQRIGPIGFILLIWTAITLITTVERSLNRIYRAPQSRALVRRVMLYWSVLTLVPIIMFVTIYLEEKIMTTIETVSFLSSLLSVVGWLGPILIGVITLAMLYCLLPNVTVSWRAALGGALVAYPLWLIGKWLFSLYVQHFIGGGSLYGALGLLPIFLMWLNISWTLFLFGAELSHTAANLKRMQSAEMAARIHLTPLDLLATVLIVARQYAVGQGPVLFETVSEKLDLPYDSVDSMMSRLCDSQVLCPVDAGSKRAFVPARPMESIPVGDILEINQNHYELTSHCNDADLRPFLKRVIDKMGGVMDKMTLKDILDEVKDHEKDAC